MTSWFRRNRQPDPPGTGAGDDGGGGLAALNGKDPNDAPEKLLERQWELVRFINANAGKLPVDAVVLARGVTDTIRSVIDTASQDRDLDIYAVVSINGIVDDYLPTTLRTYLNLDTSLLDRPAPSGKTPKTALREQLVALSSAADDLLEAAQSHDVDAMFTQGNFLRTKFSRSDLDL